MNRNLVLLLLAFLLFQSSTSVLSKHISRIIKPKKEWVKLFDGKSLKGWHHFNNKAEVKNWTIEDGALVCLGAKGPSGSGDIITDQVFGNFELRWEWKVDKGSNSGVFYHIVEDPKYKRAIETSPEYQIIDDVTYPAKLE
ncbi:MAG: DUF1080 domain-containing protein, partial [Phormidesmis sp. FL-bin-119]|nr:DUF1080 domain-containing protein [Pedobacter sp.]